MDHVQKVTACSNVPSTWQQFLRVDDNKRDLVHFVADTDVDIVDKTVVMAHDDDILSISGSFVLI